MAAPGGFGNAVGAAGAGRARNHGMQWEVEQKFAVADPSAALRALAAAGVVWEDEISQDDTYWNHPARDFALTDEALRLRQVGQRNFITYKGPRTDAATKTRQELEVPLPDGPQVREQFGQILSALGYRPVATVQKQRKPGILSWRNLEVHVAWDVVQNVGTYLELEVVADDAGLDLAKKAVESLANRLGLLQGERRSYLELLLRRIS